MNLTGKTILVTGGTGSFGQAFVGALLKSYRPRKIIVFSRDELKQYDMRQKFGDPSALRFFLGDVRDQKRLHRAFDGVDIVVHAAALKQVPTLEYNPFEAIKTNVLGAENVVNEAIERGVKKVVALSTDKAVNPANLYGATKLCAEKLFISGNHYSGNHPTRFSIVRYGNVVGSRGSIVPLFLKEKGSGILPSTDERMTRICSTLDQAVALVLHALEDMKGGEIYIPKIPSMKVTDLAKALAPRARLRFIGIRPGEKLHEMLMTENESALAEDHKQWYVIRALGGVPAKNKKRKNALPEGYTYTSNANKEWLSPPEIKRLIEHALARELIL